jgi:hypothetical protein
MADRSIAAIATAKSDRLDNAGLTVDVRGPGLPGPRMFREFGDASQREPRRAKASPGFFVVSLPKDGPTRGILPEAKCHRRFPPKDYEIKRKER